MMVHPRRVLAAIGAVALIGTVSACSSEDAAEGLIENMIERQAEGGENVDIDLSGGNIRVDSEDGSFEMTTDEDGNIRIVTDDGETVVNGEDGNMVVESDDGTAEFTQTQEFPDDFPAEIPVPPFDSIDSVTKFVIEGKSQFGISGLADGDAEQIVQAYRDALAGAGFEINTEFYSNGAATIDGTNGEYYVSFNGSPTDGPGGAAIYLNVVPNS